MIFNYGTRIVSQELILKTKMLSHEKNSTYH